MRLPRAATARPRHLGGGGGSRATCVECALVCERALERVDMAALQLGVHIWHTHLRVNTTCEHDCKHAP
eukprot:345027-Chlamydomonas_euryale.AAC.4